MASTTKIMNRLTFAKRAFSTSAARMSGDATPGMSKKIIDVHKLEFIGQLV